MKFGTTCPSVIFLLATGSRPPCLRYLCCWLSHVFDKRTPFKINCLLRWKRRLMYITGNWESKILLGVENNVKLDLLSRQLMPLQSTERKKSWHSQTCLVCDRCCALVNSFLNRAIVTTCPVFLDVWDDSEYCDTNISNFFSRKQLLQWGSKRRNFMWQLKGAQWQRRWRFALYFCRLDDKRMQKYIW